MLQNRVDSCGEIHAVPERGLLMGNRGGVLHRPDRTLGRARWRSKAWICCLLAFKGKRRQVMASGRYTELFFLDDATALSAGHRPCAECRRQDFAAFRAAWMQGLGRPEPPRAGVIDAQLHQERLDPGRRGKRLTPVSGNGLVPGSMVRDGNGAFWLVRTPDRLLRWSFSGYGADRRPEADEALELLTPPSTVAALRAGYRPLLHPSAA